MAMRLYSMWDEVVTLLFYLRKGILFRKSTGDLSLKQLELGDTIEMQRY